MLIGNAAIMAAAQAIADATSKADLRQARRGFDAIVTLREQSLPGKADGRTAEWLKREWVIDNITLSRAGPNGWELLPLAAELQGPFVVRGLDAAAPYLMTGCYTVGSGLLITIDAIVQKLNRLRSTLSRDGACRCFILFAVDGIKHAVSAHITRKD